MGGRKKLQLILTSESEERILLGLNIALVAASTGVGVVVFFALDASTSVCATHGGCESVAERIAELRTYEIEIYCCSACAHRLCRAEPGESPLIDGVASGGMASLVERASEDYTTITL